MKRLLLSAIAIIFSLQLVAQTANVVLYTENGERFYAIMNGTRMNDEPVTNLKVQDLNQPNYGLKIIFENKELGEMNKNLYLELGSEVVYAVKMNKKGSYKLAYRSAVPLAQAAPPAPQQQVVYWGAPVAAPAPTTTVVEETVTTTTTAPDGENVSVNINANGMGLSMNVNTNGTDMSGNSTTTTTTTTTVFNEQPVEQLPPPCNQLAPNDFNAAKASVKSKSFSDSKMALAKQISESNCLTAQQVKELVQLFDFESDRLEFAKFAHPYCLDQNNYYKVNDAFDFESSIEELDEYISSHR